ncbi:MAG: hypothetical protein M1548_02905 [Actinobacteria bacterium]|nr:hypothetical protein [Actinomycetota bacterium]
MVALRCTKKLLSRIGLPSTVTEPSTTVLGDWFANLIYVGRQRFILLVSERSRLPVLLPGRDVKNLANNLPEALSRVLLGLGISPFIVKGEVGEMHEAVIAKTNNRSVLGTLNDFAIMLDYRLGGEPYADLVDVALWLSDVPVGPLGYDTPGEVARRLFSLRP